MGHHLFELVEEGVDGLFAPGQEHQRIVFVLLKGSFDDLLHLGKLFLVEIVHIIFEKVVEFEDGLVENVGEFLEPLVRREMLLRFRPDRHVRLQTRQQVLNCGISILFWHKFLLSIECGSICLVQVNFCLTLNLRGLTSDLSSAKVL